MTGAWPLRCWEAPAVTPRYPPVPITGEALSPGCTSADFRGRGTVSAGETRGVRVPRAHPGQTAVGELPPFASTDACGEGRSRSTSEVAVAARDVRIPPACVPGNPKDSGRAVPPQ